MTTQKKFYLLKSLYAGTVIIMLAIAALTYQIGWQRGAAKIQDQCETICVD